MRWDTGRPLSLETALPQADFLLGMCPGSRSHSIPASCRVMMVDAQVPEEEARAHGVSMRSPSVPQP